MSAVLRRLTPVLLAVLVSSGCTLQEVKPWQRGYLAKPEMGWSADGNSSAYREHVYFSKEASSGGASTGGGGCGCN